MVYTVPIERSTHLIERTTFEPPKEGCECMFVKLNKKEGIKIYPSKENALFAYNRQKKAYECGVAPNVFSKVGKCLIGNLLQFDRYDVFSTDSGVPRVYGYFYITEVAKKVYRWDQDEGDKVEAILEHLGYETEDMMEARNLGRVDGRLVAIDFGKLSTAW